MQEAKRGLEVAGSLAAKTVLSTARVTGKATLLCQRSICSAYKNASCIANKTTNFCLSSVKWINPFSKRKSLTKPAEMTKKTANMSLTLMTPIWQSKQEPVTSQTTTWSEKNICSTGVKVAEKFEPENKPEGEKEGKKSQKVNPTPQSSILQPHNSDPETKIAVAADNCSTTKKDIAEIESSANKVLFKQALQDMKSEDENRRLKGIISIENKKHDFAVSALVTCFAQENSVLVKEACVNSLAKQGSLKGIPIMKQALADNSPAVRLAAVRGIYRLAGKNSAEMLVPMLKDNNEDVRRRVVSCLGWLDSEPLASALLPLLKDKIPAVRSAALEAMGNLRARCVVTNVIEMLSDPTKTVRTKAFSVLPIITGKNIKKTLPEDEEKLAHFTKQMRIWWDKESLRKSC